MYGRPVKEIGALLSYCTLYWWFCAEVHLLLKLDFLHGFHESILLSVWCRRTDELVDGPNSLHITPTALDRWELRLEDLFSGHPYDMFDAALSDTVSKFHLDIQVQFSSLRTSLALQHLHWQLLQNKCCLHVIFGIDQSSILTN